MASFRKKLKKVGRKVQKTAKRLGRETAPIKAKIIPYVTAVGAGVVTVLAGPAAGAGVTALGAGAARYQGATAARAKGKKGRHARKAGRKVAARTLKYGALGTGAGAIGGAIVTGSLKGALTGVLGAGSQAASSSGIGARPTVDRSVADFGQDAPEFTTADEGYRSLGMDPPTPNVGLPNRTAAQQESSEKGIFSQAGLMLANVANSVFGDGKGAGKPAADDRKNQQERDEEDGGAAALGLSPRALFWTGALLFGAIVLTRSKR